MRMTLTDVLQSNSSDQVDQSAVEAGNALKTIITEAEIENRVVNGIHCCAAQLQNCPDNVMACILADYGPLEDVTINIEHTLLEAYCMENYIKVIKVDSSKKMKKYLSTLQKNNKYPERSGDYTCMLIKNPKVTDEKAENTLLKFEKLHHIWGWHLIEFPV